MFIYVFSETDKNSLLSQGYRLLKQDERNGYYVFENSDQLTFGDTNMKFVFSDTLTF